MTFALHPDVSTAVTEYGIVLLDGRDGRYFQLNGTAATAFRALVDGGTVEQAAERLTAAFDVTPDRAGQDVERLVAKLVALKVVAR
ncbi:lasso peptide biosynthesis PqqD family chaperone [Kitasatospora sp. NPDC059577]|uniref:lasso peptide biosynthesis PqqD family chaperone n=1 Tax=Kitasatospora sp. NPDC059577 TaxID=3346873 RepID=UPI0036B3B307